MVRLWRKIIFVDGVCNKRTKANVEPWEQALKSLRLREDTLVSPCVSVEKKWDSNTSVITIRSGRNQKIPHTGSKHVSIHALSGSVDI